MERESFHLDRNEQFGSLLPDLEVYDMEPLVACKAQAVGCWFACERRGDLRDM